MHNQMDMGKNRSIIFTIVLSIISLIFHPKTETAVLIIFSRFIDSLIVLILLRYYLKGYLRAEYKKQFLLKNFIQIIFAVVMLITTIFLALISAKGLEYPGFILLFNSIRSFYLIYLASSRIKTLRTAVERFTERPARSIIASFLAVITAGTILLMLPFSTADNVGLLFIDAFFTSTSAVCVTGLIVVDTATAFSLFGKIVILLLIQTGGLGIMMLSYFSIFVLRRQLSIEDKQRLSTIISDSDLSGITDALKRIVRFCLIFEAAGAVILFGGLTLKTGLSPDTAFSSVFHSVSAFCNAGFSLYSDSLEGFSSSPLIILTVSTLIIAGGLSFGVFFNLKDFLNPVKKNIKLDLNSKIVLSWTGILLLAGFIIFYAAEHRGVLKEAGTPEQYLSAFFQSVTLRTAGFNSVDFSVLAAPTILIMCVFMFIGAASGSTAGGIKINTSAVIMSYLRSLVTGSAETVIYNHQLSRSRVLRAFVVFQFGISLVFAGSVALAFTQDFELKDILFETVSAFGTVGLSTGITSQLNSFGKLIIILLMFNGRIGPLTILSFFSGKADKKGTIYPKGDILIG